MTESPEMKVEDIKPMKRSVGQKLKGVFYGRDKAFSIDHDSVNKFVKPLDPDSMEEKDSNDAIKQKEIQTTCKIYMTKEMAEKFLAQITNNKKNLKEKARDDIEQLKGSMEKQLNDLLQKYEELKNYVIKELKNKKMEAIINKSIEDIKKIHKEQTKEKIKEIAKKYDTDKKVHNMEDKQITVKFLNVDCPITKVDLGEGLIYFTHVGQTIKTEYKHLCIGDVKYVGGGGDVIPM